MCFFVSDIKTSSNIYMTKFNQLLSMEMQCEILPREAIQKLVSGCKKNLLPFLQASQIDVETKECIIITKKHGWSKRDINGRWWFWDDDGEET